MKIRSKSNSNRTMLTGHESLIRLIGKRRRFLPNRQSLLSDPIQLSSSLVKVENEAEDLSEERNDNLAGTSGSDKVTCPVCGNKVRGEEYMINSHLDACLTRGTKRKLSQQTLLQFNFSPRSKVQACLTKSDDTKSNIISDVKDITELIEVDTEETDSIIYESSSSSDNASLVNIDGSAEISVNDDTVNYGGIVNSPSLVSEIEASENESGDLDDDISGKILATFIVGRKFGEEGELHTETSITFCRDPENIKDPNAIKVLSGESECNKVLGYIPRELAEHLSKLMDTFGLTFEGRIMSVPEHSHAAVPIQIWCQEKTPYSEIEGEKVKLYKSLCQQVLATVRLSEESPPGMMKYQQNFCLLLQEVLRTTPHVFTHDEKTLLENFLLLSNDSQKLFIRLYTRKGPWFRMSNISYAEILDHQSAVKELSAGGYVCSTETTSELHKDDFERILNLLNVGELREMLSLIKKKHSQSPRKQDSISALLSAYEEKSRLLLKKMVLEKTGSCIRISPAADLLIWRVERLFFCNGEQDLSAFLLVDLGIVKYPTYNCVITDQIFSNRNDLLSYEEALEVAQIMDESLEENNSSMVLKCIAISDSHISIQTSKNSSAPFQCFSASWVYSKVVLLGVSFLESERRYNDAINLLKRLLLNFRNDRRRGYWTLRLSTDLEHLGRVNESLSVAETGLDDPWVRAGSKISLQRRVLRLGKPPRRWKVPSFSDSIKRKIPEVHVEGRPLNCKTGTKSRFYGEDGEQCGVEELALQYYAGEEGGYWKGVHSESGIWLTVFGILMWDAIFADVANVFLTRFQTSPLDLETDYFYESRKNIIESLLVKIQQGMGEEMLITSWELHFGTACRCVNWNRHSLTELRAVVSCIGGGCLASICRHLAQDYRSWSSGMPDLLLWRFHSDYSGEAKLVEVKGPRDRVSEQQRAWLLFFMDSGFNAEVCRVNPPVANKVFV
ncbi:fanconi-associated nuclease 1 homolog isoform X1 [Lactuca sativa]|uniref:fanconi-associated nuclease 1 homolog isoform X1 n=1 Tax=Lactuca sativa TaxID=4236 RepID=UPI000CD9C4FB|nr:fanconi-associated nuclease 1 homolog isoform X1 [Lactuca sativa]